MIYTASTTEVVPGFTPWTVAASVGVLDAAAEVIRMATDGKELDLRAGIANLTQGAPLYGEARLDCSERQYDVAKAAIESWFAAAIIDPSCRGYRHFELAASILRNRDRLPKPSPSLVSFR